MASSFALPKAKISSSYLIRTSAATHVCVTFPPVCGRHDASAAGCIPVIVLAPHHAATAVQIRGLPTVLLINDMSVIMRAEGALMADELTQLVRRAAL